MHSKPYRWLCWLLVAIALATSGTASAHFQNHLARIVHIEPADSGSWLYARLPLAAVLLPENWQPGDPVPYSILNVDTDQTGRPDTLLLDRRALVRDPILLRERLGQALLLESDLELASPAPQIKAIRIEPISERSPFSHLPQIRAQLTEPLSLPVQPLLVADAVIDYRAFYPGLTFDNIKSVTSSRHEWPDIAARSINILTLHRPEGRQRQSSQGPLYAELQTVSTRVSLLSQIRVGFHHVLIGLDHVLFMLTLMLAAQHWRSFLRSSLAFTLGHSLTLALGTAGWIAASGWFVSMIETAIALTILYSGVLLLLGKGDRLLAGRVFLIGLLHGCGFAFVLQQASGSAPGDLLMVWFCFNLGIELGQLSIYLAATPLLFLIRQYWPLERFGPQPALALPCLLIATFWTLERGFDLAGALGWIST
ncbi:HupE/UreJ family protein [Marinobacterium arenosum]|uniref:HupE/UreJ family protein n=1 Tax=Marinobacterium arenosum TaxID=2862496 RepID=UPI001C98322D|nr:HupE/UreJ family protein [Marinobacterium arenosum]MBY4674990.1 HupE/UreJ family protein [Marinobacterium arenosum]